MGKSKKTSFIIPPSGLETRKSKSGLIFIIGGIAILATILVVVLSFVLKKDTIETAINEYSDGDYISSIKILNRLLYIADFRTSEKIYFYRCRALYKIAESLEKDYLDELLGMSILKKGSTGYANNRKKIEKKLKKINESIHSDLKFIPDLKQGRIFPGGRFYDEYLAKYRGSQLFHDLDFEIFEYKIKHNPSYKIQLLIDFYKKYPDTDNINQLIKILLQSLKDDETAFNTQNKILFDIIISYLKRYPTSSLAGRMYISKGKNINVRNSSSVSGTLVAKIKEDEILIQLEKSMEATVVGTRKDYWYKVVSLQGVRGWIFGRFLEPMDLSKFKITDNKDSWKFEENFETWMDSHTPEGWTHFDGGDRESIDFIVANGKKVAQLNSVKGKKAGLYHSYTPLKSFIIETKARFKEGDAITVFAYVFNKSKVFYLKLTNKEINVSGRVIPYETTKWNEYRLESGDGDYASLYINGEKVSNKIKPVANEDLKVKGLYCLYSAKGEASSGEIAYIKLK